MRLSLCFFLLLGLVAQMPQASTDSLVDGNVRLMSIEEGDTYGVAVKVPKGTDADRAVVTIHYLQSTSGISDHPIDLWVARTSAVELVPDAFVAADTVPVPRARIQRIEVVLVKDVEQHTFEMQPPKSR
jgi:hypothetical protein